MSNSRLIFKNTIFLYFRQILVLFVALFTTRIVINSLGIEDYGLYNLIAGVVTMLNIITSSMTSATQRFLSMSLGKGNREEFQGLYDVCYTIYLVLCLFVLLVGEGLGSWFINTQLSIPVERIEAANWCYQFSILSFLLGVLRIPSNAVIFAYEKMDFYAYVSIVEVFFQMGIAYSLYITPYDHLISYSVLIAVSTVVINLIYSYYCRYKLQIRMQRISFSNKHIKPLLSFSFWTLFGSIATIGTRQGINFLINIFGGVRLNAASAVATKVSSNAYNFVANFTTAYRPQIMKLYAAKSFDELYTLLYRTTKLSCFLFLVILIPIDINIDSLLLLWLGEVPEYSSIFCRLLLLYLLIDAMQSPLIAMVHAIGNIKKFQIVLSSILILNIPIMWILLKMGQPIEYIYVCYVALNVVSSVYRVFYVKNKSNMDFKKYMFITFRIIVTYAVSYSLSYMVVHNLSLNDSWTGLIGNCMACLVLSLFMIYLIGLNRSERCFVYTFLKSRVFNRLSHQK